MRKYIFFVPEENKPIGDVYYPDERDAPMLVEPLEMGRETCEMEYVSDFMSWHCKACGQMDMAPRNPKPRYCKWCGRKVVDA